MIQDGKMYYSVHDLINLNKVFTGSEHYKKAFSDNIPRTTDLKGFTHTKPGTEEVSKPVQKKISHLSEAEKCMKAISFWYHPEQFKNMNLTTSKVGNFIKMNMQTEHQINMNKESLTKKLLETEKYFDLINDLKLPMHSLDILNILTISKFQESEIR